MRRFRAIFLNGHGSQYWIDRLTIAVKSLGGELEIANNIQKYRLNWQAYRCAILESTPDVTEIISEILEKNKAIKIIVVSIAPRWDQAREVMLAGAADYIRKDSDILYLTNALKKVLKDWETSVNDLSGRQNWNDDNPVSR